MKEEFQKKQTINMDKHSLSQVSFQKVFTNQIISQSSNPPSPNAKEQMLS
jgi:hypothetical protein